MKSPISQAFEDGAGPTGRPFRARVWRWLWFGAVKTEAAEKDFASTRRDHERIETAHVWAAMLLCFLLPGPTTVMELAAVPVVTIWLARLPVSWRAHWHLAWQPHMVLVAAFVAWEFLTLLWSRDVHLGLRQIASARWIWIAWVIWPVLDHRRALIYALCAGFLFANLGQVLHWLGRLWEIPGLVWDRLDDRNSAWWAPVVGGTMLTAALGLHVPAAALGRGRERVMGLLGSAASLAGVIATGSRGAWLASAGLLLIGAVSGAWRAKRRGFAVAVVAVMVGLFVCLPIVSGPVGRRVHLARTEIAGALEKKEFMTDTGARLLMSWWAVEAFLEHPIAGVGAGGYPGWVREHLAKQGIDPKTRQVYVHAHNTFLHIAATTGAVGLSIALALTAVVIASAVRLARTDPRNAYSLGPVFAIGGLLLVSPFDTVHVNSQTAAMVAVLLALCPAWKPDNANSKQQRASTDSSGTLPA